MDSQYTDLFYKAKDLLKIETTAISFETWIKPLEIESVVDNIVTLRTPSSIHKDMVESRYLSLIVNTFNHLTSKSCEVILISPEDKKEVPTYENDYQTENSMIYGKNHLNPKYTFETFVVGENNRFAVAASLGVSEAPGTAYNPLFLYGGVGLGKTHLMHAIGNFVFQNNKNANILYVTSEKFTNELVNAIKDNSTEQFRAKYRSIDLLLIDDIQFIAGKERVQEEFFHTFNTLHENGKQIVISSDKPPRDIYPLEERLRSRFEWGLLADVSVPDYETRLAILRKKAITENLIIDDAILSNIAFKIESNVRELEGALNRIIVEANLQHTPITIEMSEKAINDIIITAQKAVTPEYIQEVVSRYFSISVFDLKSAKRSEDIAYARQVAMFLCRELLGLSYKQIGKEFGGRDHSTVMFAFSKIDAEIKDKKETKLIVDSVKNLINDK